VIAQEPNKASEVETACGSRGGGEQGASRPTRDSSSSAATSVRFQAAFGRLPKVLNSTEDAHTKSMSTFEADEHLQEMLTAFAPWSEPRGY
jgi:hypothetical protein